MSLSSSHSCMEVRSITRFTLRSISPHSSRRARRRMALLPSYKVQIDRTNKLPRVLPGWSLDSPSKNGWNDNYIHCVAYHLANEHQLSPPSLHDGLKNQRPTEDLSPGHYFIKWDKSKNALVENLHCANMLVLTLRVDRSIHHSTKRISSSHGSPTWEETRCPKPKSD